MSRARQVANFDPALFAADEVSGDKVSGGTIGAGTLGSGVTFPAGHIVNVTDSGAKSNVGWSLLDRNNLENHDFTITAGNKCLVYASCALHQNVDSATNYCHVKMHTTSEVTERRLVSVSHYRISSGDTYSVNSGWMLTSAVSGTTCSVWLEIDAISAAGYGWSLELIRYLCLEIQV